jgi:hypothetical protein
MKCLKHYATCRCEGPIWTTSDNPQFLALREKKKKYSVRVKEILRLVDTRGTEREFHDNHVGYFAFLPGSLRQKIADILKVPIYSVAREMNGDILHRTKGSRVFVQTGEQDGKYMLTYEVISKDLCEQVIAILDAPITQELRNESEADYRRMADALDHHYDPEFYYPKEAQ